MPQQAAQGKTATLAPLCSQEPGVGAQPCPPGWGCSHPSVTADPGLPLHEAGSSLVAIPPPPFAQLQLPKPWLKYPCRLTGACSCCLASPHRQHQLPPLSGVGAKPGGCHRPAGCVHAWGSPDMLAPCCFAPLWTLGMKECRKGS